MSAQFDRTRRYRFSLHRIWQPEESVAAFIMLNPSTADHLKNDPTITRCINLSKFWGFGGLTVVNLFAYRTSSPAHLRLIKRPVGKENNLHIEHAATTAGKIIVGWGNHGCLQDRDAEVLSMLQKFDLWCIGSTKSGQPRHPLYSPAKTALKRFHAAGERFLGSNQLLPGEDYGACGATQL